MEYTLYELYLKLNSELGFQDWWPADSDNEIIIGAILVQNTNWNNVLKSLEKLRLKTNFEIKRILDLSQEELISLIRESGFYNSKAKAIKTIFNLINRYGSIQKMQENSLNLRNELLTIKGVGFETADAIRMYVFNEKVFISSAYARRLLQKMGIKNIDNYQKLDKLITLDDKFTLEDAKEFHGLIVGFAKIYLKNDETYMKSFLYGSRLKL